MRFHLRAKKTIKMLQLGISSQKNVAPVSIFDLPTSSKGFTPLHHAAEFGLEQVGGDQIWAWFGRNFLTFKMTVPTKRATVELMYR